VQKLIVFNNVTLDGYFSSAAGDLNWAHSGADDPEYNAFIEGNAGGGGTLLFGRKTYELMAAYWPTPAAIQQAPAVAEGINQTAKVVFSRTLDKAAWNNSRIVRQNPAAEIRGLKNQDGKGMAILGSGSLVSQLASEGLIDEYQFVVNPTVLGAGRTMFEGLARRLDFQLARWRAFANGKVFLSYRPRS
jgi:dihydrofolate reductase